jgi:hypothetical protein
MTKILTVLTAGTALALVSVAAPTTADARCVGCGIAAGVVGGIAAGAIIAGAAGPRYYGDYAYDPGYAYGYDYGPAYAYDQGPYYGGYRYRGYYPRSTADWTNQDRQLQGTR